jgi:hypothetical protein
MKRFITIVVIFILVFSLTNAFSQYSRRNQIELFAGLGIPLGPEEFKDYYKMGMSLNAQYVLFPTPKVGVPIFAGYERFTVNNDAINDDFRSEFVGWQFYDDYGNYLGEITDANFDVSGSASTIKFGAGVRPYLSSPESSTQFFLFGNASYNLVKEVQNLDGGNLELTDAYGYVYEFDLGDLGFESVGTELKLNKFGIGIGAGVEIPAGSSLNLIFQGMYNIIFIKGDATISYDGDDETINIEDNLTFIGVTGGVVF